MHVVSLLAWLDSASSSGETSRLEAPVDMWEEFSMSKEHKEMDLF